MCVEKDSMRNVFLKGIPNITGSLLNLLRKFIFGKLERKINLKNQKVILIKPKKANNYPLPANERAEMIDFGVSTEKVL